MKEGDVRRPKNFDDLYPGRFLKATILGDNKVTVEISDVRLEGLKGESGVEAKAILSFKGKDREWITGPLTGSCIRAMFGDRLDDWIGKRIVLFASRDFMPMPLTRDDRAAGLTQPKKCIRVWGSPDIAEDIRVNYKPPRRKHPVRMTMHATGRRQERRADLAGERAEPSPPVQTEGKASAPDNGDDSAPQTGLDL